MYEKLLLRETMPHRATVSSGRANTVGPMGDNAARSHPLPDDPILARAARLLHDSGSWGWLVDDEWRLVYDGRYKLVVYPDQPAMLYDTIADPHEDHDVAGLHPEAAARLRRALE